MKKGLAVLSVLTLLSLLVISNPPSAASAAAPASSGTPQSGGTLKIITSSLPASFGPIKKAFNMVYSLSLYPALETLVGLSKEGPVPTKLATSWDIAKNGKSLTFHLRKGVKFHDGTEFNADAVKWNLDQLLSVRPELRAITSIDVLDTYTVRLNLSSYSNTILYNLSWYDGLMESPTFVKNHDSAYLSSHLCGTGPFELASFTRDTSAVFKKFGGYWDKGKPYLDGIEYDLVRDSNTAQNAFLAGQAQIWDYVLPKYLNDLKAKGYNLNSVPGVFQLAVGDSSNPNSPFAKPQVRQAFEYAIDKKALVDTFGAGTWEVPEQPCSAKMLGFIPKFQGRTYNPAKAKQLLAEAGYPQGFKTTFYYANSIDPNLMTAVQAYLKAVGIDVELQFVDSAKNSVLATQGWQNGIINTGMGVSGSYVSVLQVDGPGPTKASSAKITPEYIALLARAAAAQDKNTQVKLNQQLVKLVFDEAVIIPLIIDSRNAVYGNSVHVDLDTITIHFWNPGNAWMSK